MNIDFSSGKITLVIVPLDLRYGFYRLAQISAELLHIDVNKGQDYVVFISKQRSIGKIIHIDTCGVDCTTRILNTGRFQVMLDEDQIPIHLTRDELETLLMEGTAPDKAFPLKIAC